MADNMPPLPNARMAIPRDADRASFSELVPFRSKKIRLRRSPILWFVAFTAVVVALLFFTRVAILNERNQQAQVDMFVLFVQVSLFYLLLLIMICVHAYAKTDKGMLFYVFPVVATYAFMSSPLWHLVYVPFDALAGGDLMETSDSWPVRLWSAFCGPGLREELVKALPGLVGAAIAVLPAAFGWLPAPLRRLLAVRGPLDGVLMGFAAAAGFTLFETGGQYILGSLRDYMRISHGNLAGAFGSALMLLLPRTIGSWTGHMAYCAITGYAIGLAVVRRRQAPAILLGGWAVAALLHGLWDSGAPGLPYTWVLIGGVSGVLAVSCLVKARQLEGALFGRAQETFGSIVALGTPLAGPVPAAAAPVSAALRPVPAVATAAMPAAAAPAAAVPGFALQVGGALLALRPGGWLDFAREPALAGQGAGVTAEVTRHPTRPDVLGLKNLGATSWQATLRDGTVQPIAAERSLRLQAGVSIDFGAGLVGRVLSA